MRVGSLEKVVIVCARGGSKGVPFKNRLSPYEGYSPFEILSKKLQKSQLCNYKKFACSDAEDILDLAIKSGFEPIRRPSELASDKSRLIEVMKYCREYVNLDADAKIVQISPVAPFLSVKTLNQFANIDWNKYEAAASVSLFSGNAHPWLSGSIEGGSYQFDADIKIRYPRQIRKKLYYPNGCIFARKASLCNGNLETNDMPKSFQPVIIDDIESINIDTDLDWRLASALSCEIPVEQ